MIIDKVRMDRGIKKNFVIAAIFLTIGLVTLLIHFLFFDFKFQGSWLYLAWTLSFFGAFISFVVSMLMKTYLHLEGRSKDSEIDEMTKAVDGKVSSIMKMIYFAIPTLILLSDSFSRAFILNWDINNTVKYASYFTFFLAFLIEPMIKRYFYKTGLG